VYSPLRGAVVDVISPIGDFFAGAVHYGSLQSENQKLQATIGQLRQEQAEKGFREQPAPQPDGAAEPAVPRRAPTVTAQTRRSTRRTSP
jgi:hypothetical protein